MRGFVKAWPVAAAALACGADPATDEAAWGPDEAWRLEVVWTVGGAEAEGDAAFGDLTGLAVDAEGRAWVVDRQAQSLTVIGPDGAIERTVGRQGGGPGEFEGIYGVTVAPDGRVWVPDTRNARFTVFQPDGTLDGTWPRPANCYGYTWPGGAVADGRVLDIICAPIPQGSGYHVVRYDTASSAYRDTVRLPSAAAAPGLEPYRFTGSRGSAIAGVPFAPSQAWSLNADGTVWFGWSGAYVLVRATLTGDTLAVVRHAAPQAPVSDDERAQAIERIERIARGSDFDASRIPTAHPAFARFVEDDAGHLWVQRQVPDGWTFDVFAPGGTHLGTVPVPEGIRVEQYLPIVIRGGTMWLVTRDELDAPLVTRVRITGRR